MILIPTFRDHAIAEDHRRKPYAYHGCGQGCMDRQARWDEAFGAWWDSLPRVEVAYEFEFAGTVWVPCEMDGRALTDPEIEELAIDDAWPCHGRIEDYDSHFTIWRTAQKDGQAHG